MARRGRPLVTGGTASLLIIALRLRAHEFAPAPLPGAARVAQGRECMTILIQLLLARLGELPAQGLDHSPGPFDARGLVTQRTRLLVESLCALEFGGEPGEDTSGFRAAFRELGV